MKKFLFYTLLALLLSHWACKDPATEEVDTSLGKHYFPLKEGATYLYEVDSIVYNRFNQSVDTFQSQLRIRYLFFFEDSTGNPMLKVETDNPNIPFHTPGNRNVTALQLRNNQIVNYTDSGKVVKMTFPLRNSNQWNAHIYNTREPNWVEIQKHNQPFSVLGTEYPQTTTAVWNDFQTPVVDFTHHEVYAHQVGMIYSENNYVLRLDGVVSGIKVILKLKEVN